jgi:hypothetical protein
VLDMVSVAAQLRGMRAGMSSMRDEMRPRLETTRRAWDEALDLGPQLRDRLTAARTSWLVADPLEPLGSYPVGTIDPYRVVASDGSQVFPDRHEGAGCYLVNVGLVDIDYRTARAHLRSTPEVCWAPADVYPIVGGVRQEVDPRAVAARRFSAECDALAKAADASTVLLTDGTLLLWWLEPDPDRLRSLGPDDLKTRAFASLDRLMRTARATDALVAGYLSSPRSTDVVSMLKVVLCTEDVVDCDRCPYESRTKEWTSERASGVLPLPEKPCQEAEPVSDASLFATLLDPGERSPRFRSAAKVAGAYDAPIDFVYVHAGAEIARVEFPAWVDPPGLERLAACVADQSRKGMGYPVALAEAHEQAVVRAGDRRTFMELVRRQGMSRPTAKLVRKRLSVL